MGDAAGGAVGSTRRHAPRRVPGAPVSRAERRRAARVRRNRLLLAAAVAGSGAVLAAWFPASDLLHQRAELASSSAQLARLDHQDARLRHEERQLRTPATLGRIAQQQYGLVPPGEEAYQVLPPSGSATGTLGDAARTQRDAASGGQDGTRQGRTGAGGSAQTPGGDRAGFLERVLQTLEFWR